MNIVSGNAPFLRSKRKTGHIMLELVIGLLVIFIAAVAYNFTLGVNYGLKAIGIMTVSILFTGISDLIAGSFRYNKAKDGKFEEYIVFFIKSNFSVVTAMIFALTVPIGTPVYVVALGSIFATLIVKHAFGGFGSNIFNPAALGRIFLALAFGGQLKAYLPGGEALGGLNAGVTVTSQFAMSGTKFINGAISSDVSLFNLWLGNYSGAIGETFTMLILLVGVVLAAREVINWRTPVFLFGTVLLSSIFIALIAGINIGEYILLQFGLGGLVFGAIFMFTDPVTSPTSNFGKALIGVIGGLLNVLIRIAGAYPEGTAFSIALVNVISPMIDKFYTGRTHLNMWKPYTTMGITVLLSVGLLTGVSAAKLPKKAPDPISSSEPSGAYDHQKSLLGVTTIDGEDALPVSSEMTTLGVESIIAYNADTARVGVIFTAEITGYEPGLKFEVALKETVFAGFNVVSSAETPGIGGRFLNKVNDLIKGQAADKVELFVEEDYVGATITAEPLLDALQKIGNHYLTLDAPIVNEPFAKYHGTYNSPAPHSSQQPFTTNVTVGLNNEYHIVSIDYDVIDSPDRLTSEEHNTLKNFYTSINVAEFKLLPVPVLTDDTTGETIPDQSGGHILPGAIYSSRALYEAIKDAFKNIDVYYGESLTLPYDGASSEMILALNVYVNPLTDTIKTLHVLSGASSEQFASKWEEKKDLVLSYYYDLEIATFKSYANSAELYNMEDFTGMSYSPDRVFNAVTLALGGYEF